MRPRTDISPYVRPYDLVSQIVDYGDLHMLSLFLRLLEKVITESAWATEVDSPPTWSWSREAHKASTVDIPLTGDGKLKSIHTAGTGTKKGTVVRPASGGTGQGLVPRLFTYPDPVKQTKVNSKK